MLRRAYYQLTHVRDAIKALKRGGLSPAVPKPRTYKPPSAETIKKREVRYGSLYGQPFASAFGLLCGQPLALSVGNDVTVDGRRRGPARAPRRRPGVPPRRAS